MKYTRYILALILVLFLHIEKSYSQCTPPQSFSTSACRGSQVTLQAVTIASISGHRWYTSPTGGFYFTSGVKVVSSSMPYVTTYTTTCYTTTTYYVACGQPHPNNFVFSPPIEGKYMNWYAAAYGYDGFLRWAFDAWPADPVRDARHTFWPAGDCYLVYPGGNSCIRFESLREGIADFEKIRILKEVASKSSDKKVKDKMKELEILLNTFTDERDYSKRDFSVQTMTDAVSKGKKLLVELSNELH